MTKIIPLEDFFKNPQTKQVKISPSGKYCSYMEPWEHRMNIMIKNIESDETCRITNATERDIYGYYWVSDERIVYIMDKGGDENTHLYAVNTDGSNLLDLTPFEGVKCDIIDDLEEIDNVILFQMNKRDNQVFDVYRLDVATGEMNLVSENPGNIANWHSDHDGKLRLATTTDGVNTSILYRESETDEWKKLAEYNFKEKAIPLFFTPDNKSIYVASNVNRDKLGIFEYDINTGKVGTLIYENSDVDVSQLLYSRKHKKITGVVFTTDKNRYHFFDKNREDIQKFIDEKLPDKENDIASSNKDENKFIIYSRSDLTLGSYYFLNTDTWKFHKLFDLSPWLQEKQMAEMKPISYTSRDGLTIHGYLTLPAGSSGKNLPLIVNPHGGPWVRDNWSFNSEVQFLANRGYAILQINYRGSTGYGRKFFESGFKQWGLAMQDDITDGVNWLISEEIADAKRIAIYGSSYGGYATLSGITKTPELYQAAIDYVGVSNLFTFLETSPPYWKPYLEMMHEMMGHPEKDKEQLIATSPHLNADKIITPLFIAQGANDPRVKKSESDQIVKALKKRGIYVEYMVKDNEGHGFRNEENRFDFYRAMERFLNEHIGNTKSACGEG